MLQGKYVFAQVMESFSLYDFNGCVARYRGQHAVKVLSCREHFLAMAFGQLAYRESLRDVTTCLFAQRSKSYHLGFRATVRRSTLAEANEKRDWRIYRDFAYILIATARSLYVDDNAFTLDLEGSCYAIDSTSIEMCLAVFPWAPYMHTKGAVKMHLQMDLRGSIPTFFHITDGKVNDVNFLDVVTFEAGSYYVMDRGYLDFKRLYAIHQAGAYFVTRTKRNTKFVCRASRAVDRVSGLRCDQSIRLTGHGMDVRYPELLRRIKYHDAETSKHYVFLTNNFTVDAYGITQLYKHRWQIELFFKWIKQHLKIKTFWGHSKNAVQTQICIALCAYLIVAIMKKRLDVKMPLYEMLQILSVSLFDKTPLFELFADADTDASVGCSEKTASLFDI
jgi:hypothetical protein